ncbi:MAG: hypothetical protein K8W52_05875 [Deltaproteobacteria bacterium]|nr:hypothetical protein [Deltaproteobacteria bacterium]
MRQHVRISILVLVAIGGLAAAPRAARAGNPKFEFLCGTFVDGEVKDVVPSPKKPKITDPIGCALRVTNAPPGWENQWSVELTFLRHIGGAKTPTDAGAKSGTFERDASGVLDAEWEVKPNEPTMNEGPYFAACEDFDINVHVFTAEGDSAYAKTLKVVQKCPKPRPVAAKITCTATAQDGAQVPITSKRRGRYGAEAAVACLVAPRAKRAKVGDLTVVGRIERLDDNGQPTSTPPRESEVIPIDEGTWVNFQVNFQEGDWGECSDATIVIEGRNDSGQLVINQKLPFKQDCPD